MRPNLRSYLSALLPILVWDRATKIVAASQLPMSVPHPVIGNVLRFTLVYNRDAAMNITLGSWSRWGFAAIAVIGVLYLLRLLQLTEPNDRLRAAALGAVSAGAMGNLIDRVLSDRGVVDYIDVGIGAHRFWVFNVADIGVTVGAVLLAYVFAREGKTSSTSS